MKNVLTCLAISFVGFAGIPALAHSTTASASHVLPVTRALAAGKWKVTKVEVSPEVRVAALGDNDPEYQGAVITINSDAIAWDVSATNKKGNYESCARPTYAPSTDQPGLTAIQCNGKPWGFGVTVKAVSKNTLVLDWYDDGILTLTRQ